MCKSLRNHKYYVGVVAIVSPGKRCVSLQALESFRPDNPIDNISCEPNFDDADLEVVIGALPWTRKPVRNKFV
jgi:hypothetical protein